jgi:hypothetical protein
MADSVVFRWKQRDQPRTVLRGFVVARIFRGSQSAACRCTTGVLVVVSVVLVQLRAFVPSSSTHISAFIEVKRIFYYSNLQVQRQVRTTTGVSVATGTNATTGARQQTRGACLPIGSSVESLRQYATTVHLNNSIKKSTCRRPSKSHVAFVAR